MPKVGWNEEFSLNSLTGKKENKYFGCEYFPADEIPGGRNVLGKTNKKTELGLSIY